MSNVSGDISLISNLFEYSVFGNAVLVAVFLLIFIMYVILKHRQNPLIYGTVFIMPTLIILSNAGYLPMWFAGVVVIICSMLMGVAMWRFFKP